MTPSARLHYCCNRKHMLHAWQSIGYMVALFSLYLLPISAQTTLDFQNFTQKDGLSSNFVLSIHQDHQGFIWIGTENGMNRFDGRHFLEFRFDPEDQETLKDSWVISIYEDSAHNLWIGTKTGLNRLNRQTGKIERIPLLSKGQAVSASVNSIYEVSPGDLWLTTRYQGLFQLHPSPEGQAWKAHEFAYQRSESSRISNVTTLNIPYATAKEVWIATSIGIDQVNRATGEAVYYPFPDENGSSQDKFDKIAGVYDGQGKIFTGIDDKLYILDIEQEELTLETNTFSASRTGAKVSISGKLLVDGPNRLLMPSYRNWIVFDLENGAQEKISKQEQIDETLFRNPIHVSLKDRQGNYWIGTSGGGLFLGQARTNPFTFYQHDPTNPYSISKGQVRSLLEDEQGNVWIGSIFHGLDYLSRQESGFLIREKSLQAIPGRPNALTSNKIIKLIAGEDKSIWVATNDNGLMQLDSAGRLLQTFTHNSDDPNSLSANRIWGLAQDQEGFIWAGTWQDGLNRIDPRTGSIKQFRHEPANANSLIHNNIRSLFVDQEGLLWIGTLGGLDRFDLGTNQFTHFKHDPADAYSLSDNLIWSIFKDQQGELWVGTDTGLNRYDVEADRFEHFFEKNGLPNNSIYGILEDDEGVLWVSTKEGLARQLPAGSAPAFFPLGFANGLKTVSFLPKAYLNSAHSELLYFGSSQGILSVKPSLLKLATPQPQLAVHTLRRFNPQEQEDEQLSDYFINGKEGPVKLNHRDQSINITLSDLNWEGNKDLRYDYQLEGFNTQWIPLAEDMQINFASLSPGRYRLLARARNAENRSSEATELLLLRVYPPWWKSPWAYACYLLFSGVIIFAIYRFQLRRQFERQEAQNLKTLNALKNRLYTNITHEFRTPLTIISGMAGKIDQDPIQWGAKGSKMISRNTDDLLNLVNQILDLRKLQAGKLQPKLVKGDIISLIHYIIESFQPMSREKDMELMFQPNVEELIMDYDSNMIQRIVANLLSNAIKYTTKAGKVIVKLGAISTPQDLSQDADECLLLVVTDEGMGIPEEQLPYIFDRFYQVESVEDTNRSPKGSGIGLSLTKELVQLLGGKITVESTVGKGSSFLVWLPISRAALSIADKPAQQTPVLTEVKQGWVGERVVEGTEDLPNLLIIEDNKDVQEYLTICLDKHYQMTYAANGKEGIEKALAEVPDIIISDVMMPEKDGFEVCDTLKKDLRTSHIPIILLTAKSDAESRISGLQVGADAYLSKPFNEKELFVRLEKLLEIRRTLQERYQAIDTHQTEELTGSKLEDAFILEIQHTIQEHIAEENFGIAELCQAIHMSRTQLHNKLKSLTGQSTSRYIRSYRIHKAKAMLASRPELNITEIAFETGFSNLKYFSKIFTEETGSSPSQFRKEYLSEQ